MTMTEQKPLEEHKQPLQSDSHIIKSSEIRQLYDYVMPLAEQTRQTSNSEKQLQIEASLKRIQTIMA